MKLRWFVAGVLAALAMPVVANAQGIVGGAQQFRERRKEAKQGARRQARSGVLWAASLVAP
jgi:hypothetical protein